ncbi:hypothetical protein [Aquirufa sp.]|jgi:hypothetical protein|uniref:hypothetical protein n=1 Tax=Aquirufa sp. TaxID=2676249 RepID=UPI0037C147FB
MKYLVIILSFFLFANCTHQPDLKGFDAEAFKQDRGGCSSQRIKQVAWLKANKMELRGTTSNNMEDILGKPDIQQLADRNQEYYIYFLEPGPHCDQKASQAKSIAFRFSAMGIATEVTFQAGIPL